MRRDQIGPSHKRRDPDTKSGLARHYSATRRRCHSVGSLQDLAGMPVCVPGWAIALVRLMSPCSPTGTNASREQFKVWARTASLNDFVLFVRLSTVFAFSTR